MFSTLGSYHEYSGGYHEYTGGCSVHRGISWVHWELTMMSVGDIMSTPGDVQYTGGYHEYTGGLPWWVWGDIMSTLGGVQYTGGYHEYTGGCSVHWGVIMSTPGDTKMHVGGYHEYTGGVQYTGGIPWVHQGFWYEWEKATTKFRGFLFSHLLRPCSCICWHLEHQTACYNFSIRWLARAQTLTFYVWSEVFNFKISPAYCVCWKMNENLCSFLLRAPKKFRHNNSSCLFLKNFWTNVSKLAGEFMTENLSQLRPVKCLDQVSVMVLTMTLTCFRFLPTIFILWLSWKGQKFCRHWPTFRFTMLIAHAPTFSGGSRMNFPKKPKWQKTRISICLLYYRIKPPVYWAPPRCTHDIPWCTHGIPPVYWTPPSVLMITPQMHLGIPPVYSW